MKKLFTFALAMTMVFIASGQQTINDANAEQRTVPAFHAIEVGSGIDLFLSQGTEAVAVSASETKYRDKITTVVVDGVLKIYLESEKGLKIVWNSGKMKLKAYVSFKDIDRLRSGGGSMVKVEGAIKVAKLDLGVSGGSDFKGKVETGELKANASGGSNVEINGSAKSLGVDASGGSNFKGIDLTVENCNVEASGGSDISITATNELNIRTSGGSDVHYKGGAVIRTIKTSGGGSVKKLSK